MRLELSCLLDLLLLDLGVYVFGRFQYVVQNWYIRLDNPSMLRSMKLCNSEHEIIIRM